MAIDRALPILGLLALAACAESGTLKSASADNFGEANRQTFAAQVIDPAPVYDQPYLGEAVNAAQAIERYRTDKVKKPESQRLTKVGASPGN